MFFPLDLYLKGIIIFLISKRDGNNISQAGKVSGFLLPTRDGLFSLFYSVQRNSNLPLNEVHS